MNTKKILLTPFIAVLVACSPNKALTPEQELAKKILSDTTMNKVETMALEVVRGGFNAGDGYGEVWIRDYNTFVELAMEVMPDDRIQDNLLTFFRMQGETGDIVDGFIDINTALENQKKHPNGYKYRYSTLEPRFGAHKNTVETDHEASLIQAVSRYVNKSGNKEFLKIEIGDKTVAQRMEWSLEFLMNERYDKTYGLLWGATTADWGDVQPEHVWGVELDESSHIAIDIYDNAFFIIAIDLFIDMVPEAASKWNPIKKSIANNVRKHLWDEENMKFYPHIYLDGSPFPADFDENKIYYHGGTAMAIQAGLLSEEEIKKSLSIMQANVKASGAPSIGLTLYPTYPEGYFLNKGMYPYGYQNGGDWTWFGGRMIHQLIRYNMLEDAYKEAQPMMDRVIDNKGFFEWYTVDGKPEGSGTFRGSAGVLYKAIQDFRTWAKQVENNKQ